MLVALSVQDIGNLTSSYLEAIFVPTSHVPITVLPGSPRFRLLITFDLLVFQMCCEDQFPKLTFLILNMGVHFNPFFEIIIFAPMHRTRYSRHPSVTPHQCYMKSLLKIVRYSLSYWLILKKNFSSNFCLVLTRCPFSK